MSGPGTITCEWCGEESWKERPNRTRFCNRSCSAQWRIATFGPTETTEKKKETSRRLMQALRARPDVQEKLRRHLAGPGNPLRSPEVRRRSVEALRKKGFPQLNGGNGELTRPQRRLLGALGKGWTAEHPISTKMPRGSGYPTAYKVDLANRAHWIAVECDGQSHKSRKIREADAKRDRLLRSRGWTVLRFWNEEIMTDLPRVLSSIRSITSKPRRERTSQRA